MSDISQCGAPGRRDEISVRLAATGDAREVGRLLHEFNTEFSEPTPGVAVLIDNARALLASGEMTVLLAGGARPDGLAQLRFRRSVWSGALDAYLEELYVVPERRGKGIGRALLDAAMATAREAGATRIDLNTGEADTAAISLYESAGFTSVEGPGEGSRMLYFERDL